MHPFYVAELALLPWDPSHPGNAGLVVPEAPGIPPAFQDEAGRCSVRGAGGTRRETLAGVAQATEQRMLLMLKGGYNGQVIEEESLLGLLLSKPTCV